ncbi:MAG: hypothetical protein N2D54_06640 [Chloroflexota bacterium]
MVLTISPTPTYSYANAATISKSDARLASKMAVSTLAPLNSQQSCITTVKSPLNRR